jgi:hypothetical protein
MNIGETYCIMLTPVMPKLGKQAAKLPGDDFNVLRRLAARLAEIAQLPEQDEKRRLWMRHNKLDQERPMFILELEPPIWSEICPADQLICTDDNARQLESRLRNMIWHHEHLPDDTIYEPAIDVPLKTDVRWWGGLSAKRIRSGVQGGSIAFEPVLFPGDDIESKIPLPEVQVDREGSLAEHAAYQDLLGDLLEIRLVGNISPLFAPMDQIGEWMGLENMMMALAMEPEWMKALGDRLLEGQTLWIRELEASDALSPNTGVKRVGTGGLGLTDELDDNTGAKAQWGQAAAQMFTAVSPQMHAEFAIRIEKPWLEMFGLAGYGCCEALHHKVDILRPVKNLRRISMSPFVDMEVAAEAVGRDYIFSRKPAPSLLACDTWNIDMARRSIRADLEIAKDCNIEFIMRTCRTLRNEPQRAIDWVKAARQEIGAVA